MTSPCSALCEVSAPDEFHAAEDKALINASVCGIDENVVVNDDLHGVIQGL